MPHSLFEQTLKGQRAAGSELFFFLEGGVFSLLASWVRYYGMTLGTVSSDSL